MPVPGHEDAKVGMVSYNGVEFPVAHIPKINARYVRDRSGRNIKYVHYTITLETVIVADTLDMASLDEAMDEIRFRLSKAGGSLTFTGKGFGSILANGPIDRDVAFGPFPTILEWHNAVGGKAANIIWQVELTLPECSGTQASNISEFTYSIEWDIDRGMTTRRIHGFLEISARRTAAGSRNITDTADNYLNVINIPELPGFQRKVTRSLSEDKRLCTFSIVDVEIASDNAWFPGLVDCSCRYSIHSDLSQGFNIWTCNLVGNFEVGAGYPKAVAWQAFLLVLGMKQAASVNAVRYNTQNKKSKPGGILLQMVDLTMSEEVFGRTVHFDITWQLQTSLGTLLAASGIWQPIPTNWSAWQTSMQRLHSARGWAGLGHQANDDVIIDLCVPPSQLNVGGIPYKQSPGGGGSMRRNTCPPPERSWLEYQMDLEVIHKGNVMVHRRLGGYSESNHEDGRSIGTPGQTGLEGERTKISGDLENIVQERGPSLYYIVLTGHAVRLGYNIPRPKLLKIGGETPTLIDWKFVGRDLRDADCPLKAAKWWIVYTCNNNPTGNLANGLQMGGDALDHQS